MNEQLKQQAHKDFDENFNKTYYESCSHEEYTEEVKSFIDSIIDRTEKATEERIVGKRDAIWNLLCEMDTNIKSEKEYADDIISIITNKSDL